MHIEVNLAMQSVSSNVKRKFYPQEIDWILNKNILRFVKSKIKVGQPDSSGFQEDQIDMNALRTLLELDKYLPVYKDVYDRDTFKAELPNNYSYLVDSRSGVNSECDEHFKTDFFANYEYIYSLDINKTTKETAPFYQNTSIKVGNLNLIPTNLFPAELDSPDMNFVISDVIENYIYNNQTSYRTYWERYKNVYKPGHLLIVSNIGNLVITYNTDGATISTGSVSQSYTFMKSMTPSKYSPNRIIRSSSIGKMQESTFARSSYNSPIVQVSGNSIVIICDKKFIVSHIIINYIRKPRLVSLSLNESCDLPEEFHMDICDRTVEYMKNVISDPNYQWKVADNELRGK